MAYMEWSEKLMKMGWSWIHICAFLLIFLKMLIFLLRKRKLAVFIACFRGIWYIFFVMYYGLLSVFIYQFLASSSFKGDWSREILISLVIIVLAVMFWIGPVRGMLGLKMQKVHPKTDKSSRDGWVIKSLWGEEALLDRNYEVNGLKRRK
ncbi:hypothetical protein [Thermoactinomyces mirandus]|uniref:Uncharacterized protein n=1 Tax=Thermoactinomyces mirandus TaxID=2756294 RepID=A0A7W2AQW7_9BACL|nr:hypothetical protein [Thermoactinomyces mirandus]MBA4600951.1 hypothetical protein [Thermoactinomyces mirandus]